MAEVWGAHAERGHQDRDFAAALCSRRDSGRPALLNWSPTPTNRPCTTITKLRDAARKKAGADQL